MLHLYRRHRRTCRFFPVKHNRRETNCRCLVWVDGFLSGERVHKAMHMRDWTRALEIIRDWEIGKAVVEQKREGVPVREACDAFLSDVAAQQLSDGSLRKYRVLLTAEHSAEDRLRWSPSLVEYCTNTGLKFTTQITVAHLVKFRAAWKDGPANGRYTPAEISELWKIHVETVRRMFAHEPGVVVIQAPTHRGKRGYRTLRIPAGVLDRVHRRLQTR